MAATCANRSRSAPHHARRTQRPARPAAFTLIELLVVVSLIVLLIAMLLPALGNARQVARTTICSSNMKQLSGAAVAYAQEYGKWFQPARDSHIPNATFRENVIWYNAIDVYLGLPDLSGNYSSGNKNDVEIKQDPVWTTDQTILTNQNNNRTIKMNGKFGLIDGSPPSCVGSATSKFYSYQAPLQPSETVLFVDGRAQDVRPTDTGTAGHFHAKEATVGLRHQDLSANVAFVDNHVSLERMPEPRLDTAAPSWFEDGNPFMTLNWCIESCEACAKN